jgi:hypothetical protein
MSKARKRGRAQKSLEQDGIDVAALLRWILTAIPKPTTEKAALLKKSKRYFRAATLLDPSLLPAREFAPSMPDNEFSAIELKDARSDIKAVAEIHKALAKPDLRISETIMRCMAVDAVTLASGRQHYEEVAALLTLAYRYAGMPCEVGARSLQRLVYSHRLARGSKLTEFSVHPFRQHLPNIKLQ